MTDYTELMEMLGVLFSSAAVMTILLIVLAVVTIVVLIYYVLGSIGLYRMAKKLNHDKAWLAWIPYAKTWLMFDMPRSEYRVLAINRVISSRRNAFWIYMGIYYGSSIVLNLLAVIPLVNYVVAFVSPLMGVALILVFIFMMYPAYKDIFTVFLPESTAKGYAVASIVCSCVGLGIVAQILLLVASCKEPVEVIEAPDDMTTYTY